jgi:ABC-2 type transport system ATP-binding protein
MEEAERLCDRVGIVDLGRLIAEGRPRELTAELGAAEHVVMTLEGDLDEAVSAVDRLEVVSRVTRDGDTVVSSGAAVRSVTVQEPDLEAVFLHLTGKTLRD